MARTNLTKMHLTKAITFMAVATAASGATGMISYADTAEEQAAAETVTVTVEKGVDSETADAAVEKIEKDHSAYEGFEKVEKKEATPEVKEIVESEALDQDFDTKEAADAAVEAFESENLIDTEVLVEEKEDVVLVDKVANTLEEAKQIAADFEEAHPDVETSVTITGKDADENAAKTLNDTLINATDEDIAEKKADLEGKNPGYQIDAATGEPVTSYVGGSQDGATYETEDAAGTAKTEAEADGFKNVIITEVLDTTASTSETTKANTEKYATAAAAQAAADALAKAESAATATDPTSAIAVVKNHTNTITADYLSQQRFKTAAEAEAYAKTFFADDLAEGGLTKADYSIEKFELTFDASEMINNGSASDSTAMNTTLYIRVDGSIQKEDGSTTHYSTNKYINVGTAKVTSNQLYQEGAESAANQNNLPYLVSLNNMIGAQVSKLNIKSVEEINSLLKQKDKKASFDPNEDVFIWYVSKQESDGIHIDGVIRKKSQITGEYYVATVGGKAVYEKDGFDVYVTTTTYDTDFVVTGSKTEATTTFTKTPYTKFDVEIKGDQWHAKASGKHEEIKAEATYDVIVTMKNPIVTEPGGGAGTTPDDGGNGGGGNGGGGNGGGGNGGGTGVHAYDFGGTGADTMISDTETPLAGTIDVVEEAPAVGTGAGAGVLGISDGPVPLSNVPFGVLGISDGPVPLAALPMTGDNRGVAGLVFAASALSFFGLALTGKKKGELA